ncbi:MAG: HD domain-containing protein [bacterium]|nr:HD domain-containing protein [bacterium]
MPNQPLQQRPPGYELFFAPLQVALDPNNYERVQFAYFASKYGHARQVRDGGERYFDHPKAAAWVYISELGGRDPHVIINALLHDISEDAYLLSPYRIGLNFGAEIALDVRALTKLPQGKETTAEYLGRILARGPRAVLVKLCDRLHNLRTLHGRSEEKRRHQIEESREYHLKVLVPALRECGEPWSAYADTMERKMAEAVSQYQ